MFKYQSIEHMYVIGVDVVRQAVTPVVHLVHQDSNRCWDIQVRDFAEMKVLFKFVLLGVVAEGVETA